MTSSAEIPTALTLTGTPREMGEQHGAIAKEQDALRAVEFYGTFLDRIFAFQVGSPGERRIRQIIRELISEMVERRLIAHIPKFYREAMEGFSRTSGLPLKLLQRAYVMPDTYSYLLGRRYRYFTAAPALALTPPGCTAFAITSSSDSTEGLVHGRNLDFPGGHDWYDHPVVVEYQPKDGMRYASVSSLGIDTAGITAMNERGITLSLNMNYSNAVTSAGTPIVAIGHEVIRRSQTLEEAADILRQFRSPGGWTFLLTSHRERNAIVAEMDGEGVSFRTPKRNHILCTNHYHASRRRRREYWITQGREIDSQARYVRTQTLLSQTGSEPLVQRAQNILSDDLDPNLNEARAFGSTVGQVHTVSSVIFDPESNRILLASGEPPVPRNEYVGFTLFPGPTRSEERLLPRDAVFGKASARGQYTAAFECYFPGEDLARAGDHLRKAIQMAPQERLYRSVLALVECKRRNLPESMEQMRTALEYSDTPYRTAHDHLYYARILDLADQRADAIPHYEEAAKEPMFARASRRGLRKAWTWRACRRLIIDFILGEAIEP